MAKLKTPDIVILVPGIMGSVLTRNGKEVWSLSGGAIVRALFSLAASVKELQLKGDDPQLDDLGDGVEAPRLMPDTHLIPGFWKIDGYTGVRDFLFARFNLEPGVNYFEFPYDWRRDNRVAARQLKRKADELLQARRAQLPGREVKLILVTHSMGGLVSRYYLECLDGAKDARLLITFGTPFRGSAKALDYVCHGFKKIVDISDLLRSFTSVYQLLPTYQCVLDGPNRKRVAEAVLPNLDQGRAAAAAAFHDEMQRAAQAAPPGGYVLYNVVGMLQPTLLFARTGGGVQMLQNDGGDDWQGDGTVPRPSATPGDPRVNPRFYVAEQHGSLQNNEAVQNNLEALIEEGIFDYGRFKSITRDAQSGLQQQVQVRMQIPDAVEQGEALQIAAQPDPVGAVQLAARVESVDDPAKATEVALTPGADGYHRASVVGLSQGCYRVTVSGVAAGVLPVRDVCAVS